MVNDIIGGIAVKLNKTFGDAYRIYAEPVRQGLKEPCFFIIPLDAALTRIRGNLYESDLPIVIQYLPQQKDSKREMADVGELLFVAMELVELGSNDIIMGRNMRVSLADGILTFTIVYKMHVTATKTGAPAEDMGAVKITLESGGSNEGS